MTRDTVIFVGLVVTVIAAAGAGNALRAGTAWQPARLAPGPGLKVDGHLDAAGGGSLKGCPTDGTANFATFSAGSELRGLQRGPAVRVCHSPDPRTVAAGAPAIRQNYVNYPYGSCELPKDDEGGCQPPLQVQNFPACERNLSLYRRYAAPIGDPYGYQETQIRSVPAAIFDGGTRIEVYSADATVVIWGQDAALVRAAADQLEGAGDSAARVTSTEPLPEPAQGALTGMLAC